MTKKNEGTKITNKVTPEEVAEAVAEIDNELPENLGEVLDKEESEKVDDENFDDAGTLETSDNEEEPEKIEKVEDEEVEEKKTPKPLPPIEERYKEAGQEAMVLNSKNKKILETIEEANNLPEPSIEELKEYAKQMGSDYEDLDTFAQNMLKENLQNKKKFGKITDLVAEERNMKLWADKVEAFATDDKTIETYPALSGHEEEFVKYCSKKTHINADFNLLVAGFLFKLPEENKKKNLLLPRSGSSKNAPAKPIELTQDDARAIRMKDPAKYMEMARTGKIKIVLD